MKRHPAFQDLSRDHYVALNRSLQVVRAVEGHPQARPFDHAKAQFMDLWEHDGLRQHFLEEETDLVPVLQANGAGELSARMLQEHADLRKAFGGLQDASPAGAAQAARALMAHARWEEDVVFEWLQANLAEEKLQELLDKSARFRTAQGLPVGPPR